MDVEIARYWVGALRGGQYKQTTGRLRRDNGYCCLGVLCDLLQPDGWGEREEDHDRADFYQHRGDAGIPCALANDIGLPTDFAMQLAKLNDGETTYLDGQAHRVISPGKTFAEIADVIEARFIHPH